MAGNVREWTGSAFDAYTKKYRGGGWGNGPAVLRASDHVGFVPAVGDADIGFRCGL